MLFLVRLAKVGTPEILPNTASLDDSFQNQLPLEMTVLRKLSEGKGVYRLLKRYTQYVRGEYCAEVDVRSCPSILYLISNYLRLGGRDNYSAPDRVSTSRAALT